jgi:hypothetical protein
LKSRRISFFIPGSNVPRPVRTAGRHPGFDFAASRTHLIALCKTLSSTLNGSGAN